MTLNEQIAKALGLPPGEYDTDWNAMRLVIERMRDRGWRDTHGYEPSRNIEWCKFEKSRCWPSIGFNESLPKAVCLAALSAVESEGV